MISNGKQLADSANDCEALSPSQPCCSAVSETADSTDREAFAGAISQNISETDPSALLLRIQKRDRDALAELFDRYSRLVLSIGWKVLRDPCEAEDLVQDVFLFIWTRGDLFDPNPCEAEDLVQDVFLFIWTRGDLFDPRRGDAHRWLVQVFYHRAFNHRTFLKRCFRRDAGTTPAWLSAHDRGHPIHGALEFPSGIDNLGELFYWQSFLKPAFESLTENQHKTLTLYYFEGYTLAEIATETAEQLGAVRNHYYRGAIPCSCCFSYKEPTFK